MARRSFAGVLDTLHHILRWTEDYAIAIKIESILANVTSMLPQRETAYDGLNIADFPISWELTDTFTLPLSDIDPSTVSLSVIAWLARFRPEIFWRREGLLVRKLAMNGRLRALELIGSHKQARTQAFGWGELDEAARAGHLNVVQYLHEIQKVPFTSKTLSLSARTGNLELVKYLHESQVKCPKSAFNEAFSSGNVNVVRYFLENLVQDSSSFDLTKEALRHGYPDLQEFIVETKPQFMTLAMMQAARVGDLDDLMDLLVFRQPSHQLLDTAIANSQLAVTKYLVEEHNIPITSNSFDIVVETGNFEVFKLLFEKAPSFGEHAILAACNHDNVDIVKYIHERHPGSCVNKPSEGYDLEHLECSRLCSLAAEAERIKVFKYLKRSCSRFSEENALYLAFQNGNLQLFKEFPEDTDFDGGMPMAVIKGDMELIRLILSRWRTQGIDRMAISRAAQGENSLEVIKILLETGKFDFDTGALMKAASKGDIATIKFLLNTKPNLSIHASLTTSLLNWKPQVFAFLDRHLSEEERKIWNPSASLSMTLNIGEVRAARYILRRDPNIVITASMLEEAIRLMLILKSDKPNFFEFLVSEPRLAKELRGSKLLFHAALQLGAWDCLRILLQDHTQNFTVKLRDIRPSESISRERILRYLTER
ncbi:hypothetical protein HDU97_007167 [Phlyctochytrium planicorne]|nr:hypothetical protein HDU97_007167 [Phlyctochytrium planicorne]